MTSWTNRSALPTRTAVTAAVAALAATALVAPTAQAAPKPKDAVGLAIQQRVDQMVTDGAIGAIARVDTPTYSGSVAAGKRAVNENPPALPNSQFRVASQTKPMVATAVLQQVQKGTWSLDTTIGEVLPGLVPGHEGVTIEQLLSHTSGMPDPLFSLITSRMQDQESNAEFFAVMAQDYTDQQIVDAMNALPWAFEPGTDFLYSNAGYVVLGMMLEARTGRTMADILMRDVFKPARMNQTEFKDAAGMRGQGLEDAGWAEGQWYSLADFNPALFSSAGSVVSTTKDINAFNDALLQGRLLDPTWLEQVKSPRSSKGLDYGLGLYRMPDPCAPAPAEGQEPAWLYGHDGASFGSMSMTLTSPDGSRNYTVAANGRYFDGELVQPYDHVGALFDLISATC
ncbi:MAG TPA: serine hydrolase domain-containing protein [Phycicoccus sp.]|jgi:D-alanyl-D-alanine carboxypeptidase|nr:serine hydrolase domain-containing protein [Phycicoccus sp.]HQH08372.1 serine hydrolase domain-containing protein [Phycicoccus sp.]HQK30958.1 serine hydrolase domain-containing protein [Phycicoccus sp.]HQY97337.1 serine hydrolase domain-containing protein [Phycicoccus sp.]